MTKLAVAKVNYPSRIPAIVSFFLKFFFFLSEIPDFRKLFLEQWHLCVLQSLGLKLVATKFLNSPSVFIGLYCTCPSSKDPHLIPDHVHGVVAAGAWQWPLTLDLSPGHCTCIQDPHITHAVLVLTWSVSPVHNKLVVCPARGVVGARRRLIWTPRVNLGAQEGHDYAINHFQNLYKYTKWDQVKKETTLLLVYSNIGQAEEEEKSTLYKFIIFTGCSIWKLFLD